MVLGASPDVIIVLSVGVAIMMLPSAPWAALAGVLSAALSGACFAAFVRCVHIAFDRASKAVVIRTASVFGRSQMHLPVIDLTKAVVKTTTSLDSPGPTIRDSQILCAALRLQGDRPIQPLTEVHSGGDGPPRSSRW